MFDAGDLTDPRPTRLRRLLDHLSAMVAYWDSNQRCRFANRAYERWFGVDPESMPGRHMAEFLGPLYELNRPYIEAVLRGEAQEFEREIPDPSGGPARQSLAQYVPDIVDGVVRGFFVLVTDVSRIKRAEDAVLTMERKLQSSERLVALGTLAAGIAHEINNPLTSVCANVQLALEALASTAPDWELVRTELVEALAASERVRDIVQSMKLLARGEASKRENVDVNDTLEKSLAFASTALRYRARVERAYGDVGCVRGNGSQLAQVFVNLLTNAAHALPESGSELGIIRIHTQTELESVLIEIADDGCGIPAELHARVFDPFFTTKNVGVGMGLGLSISAAIVRGMGGEISFTSQADCGTTFRIVLPIAAPAASRPSSPSNASLKESPGSRSPELRPRMLVIDDEPSVAKILARILAREYDVVVKTHAAEALNLLVHNDELSFSLIFCDLMMPEVSGDALYRKVVEARPELAERFVFVTGGASTGDGKEFLSTVSVPVLDKPFDVAAVRELARERLKR